MLVATSLFIIGITGEPQPKENTLDWSLAYEIQSVLGWVLIVLIHVSWLFPVSFLIKEWKFMSRGTNVRRILFLIVIPYLSGYVVIFSRTIKEISEAKRVGWYRPEQVRTDK